MFQVPKPHVVSDCCIGKYRYRTFPLLYERKFDWTALLWRNRCLDLGGGRVQLDIEAQTGEKGSEWRLCYWILRNPWPHSPLPPPDPPNHAPWAQRETHIHSSDSKTESLYLQCPPARAQEGKWGHISSLFPDSPLHTKHLTHIFSFNSHSNSKWWALFSFKDKKTESQDGWEICPSCLVYKCKLRTVWTESPHFASTIPYCLPEWLVASLTWSQQVSNRR